MRGLYVCSVLGCRSEEEDQRFALAGQSGRLDGRKVAHRVGIIEEFTGELETALQVALSCCIEHAWICKYKASGKLGTQTPALRDDPRKPPGATG